MLLLNRLALLTKISSYRLCHPRRLTPKILASIITGGRNDEDFIHPSRSQLKAQHQQKSSGAGHKSFMDVESNVRRVSLESIRKQVSAEGFKTSDESDLFEITEGSIRILLDGSYSGVSGYAAFEKKIEDITNTKHFQMFYNFVLLVERDLTLLIANEHLRHLSIAADLATAQAPEGKIPPYSGAKILTGSAQSGIKALRLNNEISSGFIESITAVEKSKNFDAYFDLIAQYNNSDASRINLENMSLEKFLLTKITQNLDKEYHSKELYDFIDIDSYGSSIEGIRSALHLIKDGGVIGAIFTDMSSLCGPNILKCFNQYHIIRSKMSSLNENAVRILYSSISDAASAQNMYIEPIITFRSDFYVKVFFKVHHNGLVAMRALENKANVLQCTECPNFLIHPLASVKKQDESEVLYMNSFSPPHVCPQCSSPWKLNGPIWKGQLHSKEFLHQIGSSLRTGQTSTVFSREKEMRIQSFVKLSAYIDAVLEESEVLKNSVLGFSIKDINGFFKASRFPQFDAVKRALARVGYEIGRCTLQKDVYKTDAPMEIIFDTIKGWRSYSARLSNESEKKTSSEQPTTEKQSPADISPALAYALKKPQKFYPKFRTFTPQEKAEMAQAFENNPSYLDEKTQRTVFFPNPTNHWGPKKQFSTVYTTHKFDQQKLQADTNDEGDHSTPQQQPPSSSA